MEEFAMLLWGFFISLFVMFLSLAACIGGLATFLEERLGRSISKHQHQSSDENNVPKPQRAPNNFTISRWADLASAIFVCSTLLYFAAANDPELSHACKIFACMSWNTALLGIYMRRYVPTVVLKLRKQRGDSYQAICQRIIDYPMHRNPDAECEMENIGFCEFVQCALICGSCIISYLTGSFVWIPSVLLFDYISHHKSLRRALKYYVEYNYFDDSQPSATIEDLKKACNYAPADSPLPEQKQVEPANMPTEKPCEACKQIPQQSD